MVLIEPARRPWASAERWFAVLTAAVLAVVGVRSAWHTFAPAANASQEQRRRLEVAHVPRRERPLDITPHGAYRDMLTDEELGPVVAAADPCWTGPDVGQFAHSLRLWGAEASFDRAWQLSGRPRLFLYPPRDQLKILLEHPEFERAFGNNSGIRMLLSDGEVGISVVTNLDSDVASRKGQFHVDKILQVLAEIGMPATTRVVPRVTGESSREWTVNDILNESLWKYSPYQEAEFTISAFSRWLSPPATWENRFGTRYNMNDLVNSLLDEPKTNHACVGMHLPYALVSALRANQQGPILSDANVKRIEARLQEITRTLVKVQQADGSWGTEWNGHFDRRPNDGMWYLDTPPFPEVYATGHHLEWIALAPPKLGPPREVVRRAVDYLKTAITAMPQPFFHHADVYPLGSHAVRALCLIRGVTPSEIRQRYPVVPNGVNPLSDPNGSSISHKGGGA